MAQFIIKKANPQYINILRVQYLKGSDLRGDLLSYTLKILKKNH